MGGATLPYYGVARSTTDIDLILLSPEKDIGERIGEFVRCLKSKNLAASKEDFTMSLIDQAHITAVDMINPLFRLDLKWAHSAADNLTFRSRNRCELYGVTAYETRDTLT